MLRSFGLDRFRAYDAGAKGHEPVRQKALLASVFELFDQAPPLEGQPGVGQILDGPRVAFARHQARCDLCQIRDITTGAGRTCQTDQRQVVAAGVEELSE